MDVREHLLAVREARGKLTPKVVVEEAAAPEHPLHDRFEWDDSVAGPQYRLIQARELIRTCRFTYAPPESTGGLPKSVRAFVAMPQEDEHAARFDPVEEVVEDPLKRQIMLTTAEREWKALRRRWEHLEEFASMVKADVGS